MNSSSNSRSKILVILILIILLATSTTLLFAKIKQARNNPQLIKQIDSTRRDSAQEQAAPTNYPEQAAQITPRPTLSPQIAKASVTPSLKNDTNMLNQLQYPNSQIVSQSVNQLTLTSAEEASIITDWYKEKLIALSGKSRSFVTTSTNNAINHVLSAQIKNETVTVKIDGNKGEKLTINIAVTP